MTRQEFCLSFMKEYAWWFEKPYPHRDVIWSAPRAILLKKFFPDLVIEQQTRYRDNDSMVFKGRELQAAIIHCTTNPDDTTDKWLTLLGDFK